MSLTMTDNGGGMVSFRAVGTVIRESIVKKSISKRTGKMNEYVEFIMSYRPKQYDEDNSCYLIVRVYSKGVASLALQMKKGWQIAVDGNANTVDVDRCFHENTTLITYATMITPLRSFCDMLMDWMGKRNYITHLIDKANALNYAGQDARSDGTDVDF